MLANAAMMSLVTMDCPVCPRGNSATHTAAAAGEEGQQQRSLQLEHLALGLWFLVVKAKQVQDPVGQEQKQLLLGRMTRPDRLACSHCRAHHDVRPERPR